MALTSMTEAQATAAAQENEVTVLNQSGFMDQGGGGGARTSRQSCKSSNQFAILRHRSRVLCRDAGGEIRDKAAVVHT
jgi:hypothetical protein